MADAKKNPYALPAGATVIQKDPDPLGYYKVDPKNPYALPPGATVVPPQPSAADQTYGHPDLGIVGNTIQGAKDLGSAADNSVRQIANGFTAGWADHAAAAANKLTGLGTLGGDTVEGQQAASAQADTETGPVASMINHGLGAAAQAVAIPGGAVRSLGGAIATGGAMNAANTEAQSYADKGEGASPWELAMSSGLGMVTGMIGHKLTSVFQRPRLDAKQAEHADVFQREGIPVTAGQATGNSGYLNREDSASGAADFQKAQAEKFSEAAYKRADMPTGPNGYVSKAHVADAVDSTGRQMDHLASSYDITDPISLQRVEAYAQRAETEYANNVEGPAARVIHNVLDDLADARATGSMTGAKFQEITSHLKKVARSSTSPALMDAAHSIVTRLNDAMESAITAVNPQQGGAWRAINDTFKKQLTIQNALAKNAPETADMLVTPEALASASKKIYGGRSYVQGRTNGPNGTQLDHPFDDLADAGRSIMKHKIGVDKGARQDLHDIAYGFGLGAPFAFTGHPTAAAIATGTGVGVGLGKAGLNATGLSLRSLPTLSPFANVAGAGLGNAAATSLQKQSLNPFTKALGY